LAWCEQGEEGLGNVGVPSYYCPQCVKTFQHKQEGRALKSQRTDELMRALLEPEPVNGTYIAKEEVYLLSRKW
jgi:transposase-like protein